MYQISIGIIYSYFTTFLCCRNTICGRNNGSTKNERKKITPQMGWHLRIRHATPFKDKARAIYTLFIFRLRCQIKLKSGILITALKDTTHTVLNHPLNSWDRFFPIFLGIFKTAIDIPISFFFFFLYINNNSSTNCSSIYRNELFVPSSGSVTMDKERVSMKSFFCYRCVMCIEAHD